MYQIKVVVKYSLQEKPVSETEVSEPPEAGKHDKEIIEAVIEVIQEQPQMLTVITQDEIPPEFVELLQPQIVTEGESAVMFCKVVGLPYPSVTWYKNSIPIESGPDVKMYYDSHTGQCTLEISEVFTDDAGEIVCRAVNPFGEAMTSATLLVQGK